MMGGYHATPVVEVDVPQQALAALLNRTTAQWQALGREDPYWSVLTDEANRGHSLPPETEKRFYETGENAGKLLDLFEARNSTKLSRGVCLELGCGVGRMTRALAKRFERVIAVDISTGNLDVCKARLEKDKISNVDCVLVSDMEDFEGLPEFDVLYSFIALQHNSPPVQREILNVLLSKARSGAFFQTATNLVDYRFVVSEYLETESRGMEVHSLPQRWINEIVTKHGLQLVETMPDACLEVYGSNTFFVAKNDVTASAR